MIPFREKLLLGFFKAVVAVIFAKLALGIPLNTALVCLIIGAAWSGWRVASEAERR